MTETRPDADALLARMKEDEALRPDADKGRPNPGSRGMLKIFFGYAAGVGKTYAMLKAAHAAQAQGAAVLAGYVEPHARPETAALLDGLQQIPPLRVQHNGIVLGEFDVDAALARQAQIILVDELAHSNAPGCRNRKRYQDIEELLRAGISVWTTVNVQHLESLNDLVAAMTGVAVRERVPDSVFDRADHVELVDIEPDDLIRRLREGKVYGQAQAAQAVQHFFLPVNLIALRETALRRMADRVNRRARNRSGADGAARPTIKEHILICLSGAPSNARVIRTAARMAEAFHADFTALYVRDGESRSHGGPGAQRLRNNTRLAEDLGAHIVTVEGRDIPGQIAAYARMSGVSKIVLGRSPAGTAFFRRGRTLVERLAELAPDMDTYIIPDAAPAPYARKSRFFSAAVPSLGEVPDSGRLWAVTILVLALCTAAGWGMHALGMHDANIIGFYMVGVLGVAMITLGPWYGAAASLLSVLLFDFFFIPPRFSLTVDNAEYLATFALMLAVALVVNALAASVRTQARKNAARALHTEFLLGNSRRLRKAENEDAILAETAHQFASLLTCDVVLYPVCGGRLGEARHFSRPAAAGAIRAHGAAADRRASLLNKDELGVAQWVLKNGRAAGAGTDTLPGAQGLYIPIRSREKVFAVVVLTGFARDRKEGALDAADKNLIRALAGECALAVERERLTRANAAIAAQVQQEKLRADVLRSISHDLRTPLTAICGNAAVLADSRANLDLAERSGLARAIEEDAHQLIDMVENLLCLTRLEQYGFTLRLEPELVEDVIREALDATRRRAREHKLLMDVPDSLLMARMDARLVVQVLINLIDNALKHTPPGTLVRVSARGQGDRAQVEVADLGPGIADAEKARVFEMFYSGAAKRGDGRRGMGVGLALCRSIIRAHGGEISVRDNAPQGVVFRFSLPRESAETRSAE